MPVRNVGNFFARSSLSGFAATVSIAFVVTFSKSFFAGRSGLLSIPPRNSCNVAETMLADTSALLLWRWLRWYFRVRSPLRSPNVARVALQLLSTHTKYIVRFGPRGPWFHLNRYPRCNICVLFFPHAIFWNSIDCKADKSFSSGVKVICRTYYHI